MIVLYTTSFGLLPWYAAFMMRSHGMQTTELGVWLGGIFGVGGSIGVLLGGYAVGRRDERAQVRMFAATIALLVPCFASFLLVRGTDQALIALGMAAVTGSMCLGPLFALIQRLVDDQMRATAVAIVMLLANLIGMSVGPELVGTLSDILAQDMGKESLRYAMLTVSLLACWSAFHFWRAGHTIRTDLSTLSRPISGISVEIGANV